MKNQNFFKISFLIIIFLIFNLPVFTQNTVAETMAARNALSEIDVLINETDYNTALRLINVFINNYPNYFDEVQKRVERILVARKRYAEIAEELLYVIQTDPSNNERILDIIARLEALEKNPTASQLAFVRDARKAALFSYYRAQYNEIQNKAAELYAKGDYSGAVDMNHSGFYMYRDDFFFDYRDTEEAAIVENALKMIEDNIENYRLIQNRFKNASRNYIAAAERRDGAAAENAYAELEEAFRDYAETRNTFFIGGKQLADLYNRLFEASEDITDTSFLPFITRYVNGRNGVPNSGIVGIADGQWESTMAALKQASVDAIVSLNETFVSRAETSFISASAYGTDTLDYANIFARHGSDINGYYSLIATSDGTRAGAYPAYGVSMDYEAGIAYHASNALKTTTTMREVKEAADRIQPPQNAGAAERVGNNFVANIIAAVASIESVAVSVPESFDSETWAVAYQEIALRGSFDDGDELYSWTDFENVYRSGISELASFTQTNAGGLWERAGKYYEECSNDYLGSVSEQYENIRKLYDGVPFGDDSTLTVRYPQEALALIDGVNAQIINDRVILLNARNVMNDSTYRTSVARSISVVDDAIARLNEMYSGLGTIATGARELIQRAERAKQEAERNYAQAQQALEAGEFEAARKYLQEARVKYNESLSYQESAALRAESDERLAMLGDAIMRAENELVVVEVRQLKTQARTEYYNGNFENAEMILNQARQRWLVTNIDEDQEILNLLALVTTALSMNSGRNLSMTSPIYPEMSQTLSMARTYFDEGQRLLTEGNRTEGRRQLELALKRLQELQLVYPLNQDASLLSLRIQQILDPQGFETLFANRVASARSSYRNPAQQREAYTALVDLHEINPDYPGLSQLIYDVEIAIGVRQRPIDTAALARSRTLTTQAQGIVDAAGRDEIQLMQALALVEEAMELNPNNDSAMLLKDRIQIAIGGGSAVVLSAEDEAKYQQAIQALQRNNIVTANALVEQLLQNPTNRRSSKILDLQRQIRALL